MCGENYKTILYAHRTFITQLKNVNIHILKKNDGYTNIAGKLSRAIAVNAYASISLRMHGWRE